MFQRPGKEETTGTNVPSSPGAHFCVPGGFYAYLISDGENPRFTMIQIPNLGTWQIKRNRARTLLTHFVMPPKRGRAVLSDLLMHVYPQRSTK